MPSGTIFVVFHLTTSLPFLTVPAQEAVTSVMQNVVQPDAQPAVKPFINDTQPRENEKGNFEESAGIGRF